MARGVAGTRYQSLVNVLFRESAKRLRSEPVKRIWKVGRMTGTKKTDQTRERQFKDFSGKAGAVFTNSLGLLSAFGIAFGGLFLVHHRLVREENAILDRGGRVEVLVQSEAVAAQEAGEEISVQAPLTESQLYRVVEKLETEREGAVPQEPWVK